jgi:hypothetical protein
MHKSRERLRDFQCGAFRVTVPLTSKPFLNLFYKIQKECPKRHSFLLRERFISDYSLMNFFTTLPPAVSIEIKYNPAISCD